MTRRKLRRLYMVEAAWSSGITRSRCYQSSEAASHRAALWTNKEFRDGACKWVQITPTAPVVWNDDERWLRINGSADDWIEANS